MAAATPDEMMFTGESDPSASPIAAMIVKQLVERGMQPTAGNMRRAVEANARGTGQAGPDMLAGVRNDVVENAAPASTPARANAPLPTPPIPPEQTATPAATPPPDSSNMIVDPGTGIPGYTDGPQASLGGVVAAALPLIYALAGRGRGRSHTMPTVHPDAPALPAPPPAQIAGPQLRLPAPTPGAGNIPTMTVTPSGASPVTSAPPPIRMPPPAAPPPQFGPPPAPVAPPAASVPPVPPVSAAPTPASTTRKPRAAKKSPIEFVQPDPKKVEDLKLQLSKRPPGMGQRSPIERRN